MRSIVFLGLVLAMFGLGSGPLPAQAPRSAPAAAPKKSDPATEPKKNDSATEPKKPAEINWFVRIQGKSLEQWVALLTSLDASTRDEALRTIPLFGPKCREAVGHHLIDMIRKETDSNVRLTAISSVPLIYFHEPYVEEGLGVLINILRSTAESSHTRLEATAALGKCGPAAKRAIPVIVDFGLGHGSWQNRKVAVAALGLLGQQLDPDEGPDVAAIKGLIKTLRTDNAHLVRREVVNSLLLLGPPKDKPTWTLLRKALSDATKDSDKHVVLWSHVALIRTEEYRIKEKDPNLLAVSKVIVDNEAIVNSQDALLKKLGDGEDPKTKFEKQGAAQNKEEALEMKLEAIKALAFIGNEAAPCFDQLKGIVLNPNEEPMVAATAIWALSRMPIRLDDVKSLIDPFRAEDKDPKTNPAPISPAAARAAILKAAADEANQSLTAQPAVQPEKKKAPPKK
jgi:hypothetical protein